MTSVAEPGQDCRTDSGRVAAFLREADHDRYLATLFAPAERRDALIALYAFNAEIARVREIVSDALPGEMRYQWWREVLHGDGRGDVSAHPVAAALLDVVRLHRLPLQSLENLIDARTFDLYDDPMPSLTEFEGYCGETSSALIRLASLVLADGQDPGGAEAAGHAGVAYAVAGLLRALPWHASRGQVYVPQDVLERHGVSPRQIVEGQDFARAAVRAVGDARPGAPPPRRHARSHFLRISRDRPGLPAGGPGGALSGADGARGLPPLPYARDVAGLAQDLDPLARGQKGYAGVRGRRAHG